MNERGHIKTLLNEFNSFLLTPAYNLILIAIAFNQYNNKQIMYDKSIINIDVK
jgi:competence protein ComGF